MTQFPYKALLVPPLMPLAAYAAMSVITATDHQWNVHGDFILLIMAWFATGILSLLIEGFAVPRAWHLLNQHTPLRTRWNYAAFGVGSAYLLAASIAVIWFIAELFIAP